MTQEIQQLLAIPLDDSSRASQLRGGFFIDRFCAPIVEVVGDYVQFVHFTVQEYALAS